MATEHTCPHGGWKNMKQPNGDPGTCSCGQAGYERGLRAALVALKGSVKDERFASREEWLRACKRQDAPFGPNSLSGSMGRTAKAWDMAIDEHMHAVEAIERLLEEAGKGRGK